MSDSEIVKPPIPASAEKARLVDFLRTAQNPTYPELSQLIGENVQGLRGRQIVLSARRELEDEGIYFQVKRNRGLTRCGESQKNELVTSNVKGVRRKVRRTHKIQVSVDYGQLKQLERLRYSINETILGILSDATSVKFANGIQKRIQDGIAYEQPDLIKLLRPPRKKTEPESKEQPAE